MSLDVRDWLCRLDLEQYVKVFRDNAIDAEVLPRLTAEDLKDLGVSLVGHRRLLLDAIAALNPKSNATTASGSSPFQSKTLLISGTRLSHKTGIGLSNAIGVLFNRETSDSSEHWIH